MRIAPIGLFPILCLGAVILPGPCLASGTVMVNGAVGRDCYLATMQDSTPDNDRKAITACDLAVASSAGDPYSHMAAYVNRSDVWLRMKDFQNAVADSEQAIALDPAQPVAHLNQGAAMVGLARYEDAVGALDQAITLNVQPIELAYFNRALAKEALGDVKGAYLDYKKALEAAPKFERAATELQRFKVTTR